MSSSDLKNWPIFNLLEPNFVATIEMVFVYGDLGNEALIVTKDRMVYGLGCNRSGCLGIGSIKSTLHPKKIDVLCEKGIKTFAYGSDLHVLALTIAGEVYCWGHEASTDYNLQESILHHVTTPTLVESPLKKQVVVDIACGSYHSLALTDTGKVYAWGKNDCGQVGSKNLSYYDIPNKVIFDVTDRKVVFIACGQTFSMAVTNDGKVYGWGHNEVGQLGNGNYLNQLEPCEVKTLSGINIKKVACGYAHTVALSDEGALYVWGSNKFGQLGLKNKTHTCKPTKLFIPTMYCVSEIAALHYSHISVAIGQENTVFMWGQCRGLSIIVPTTTPFTDLHNALAYFAFPSVMHRPLHVYAEEEMNIAKYLKQAFDDPTTSDLTIQVQGKSIHVHKAVLKIRCQYFKTMFQECWAENNQSVIQHDQFSYTVYKSFLKYLYTDEIDSPFENVLELLNLANTYIDAQLQRQCIRRLKQEITVLNAALLYNTAIEYNAEELEEFCFKFILCHMTAVVQTPYFASMNESIIKKFVIKASYNRAFRT